VKRGCDLLILKMKLQRTALKSGSTKSSTARRPSARSSTRACTVKMKEAKIRQWVDDGRILPVEPSSLLYMIRASTRHYADFDHQVNILNDHQPLSDTQFERAVQTVTSVILRGIGLEP